MSAPSSTVGPFVHGLNKGGLFEIARTRQLRGTEASNNMASDRLAVRAYVGSFEHQKRIKNWSDPSKTLIEFVTQIAPRTGLPPGYAEWGEDQLVHGYLPITITR